MNTSLTDKKEKWMVKTRDLKTVGQVFICRVYVTRQLDNEAFISIIS